MITISGNWYPIGTSQKCPATLQLHSNGRVVVTNSDNEQKHAIAVFSDLRFSERIGSTARFVEIADVGKFETSDNNAIDKAIKSIHGSTSGSVIHTLESRWRFVVISLLIVITTVWMFAAYGVPAIADSISRVLPQQALSIASQQTLATLDKLYFENSQLSNTRQQELREHFAPLSKQHPDLNINTLFRAGGALGANAFALPDGTIVFTDEIVELAEHDDELMAIFAHEVGHVEHRHGARSVIQGSLLTFLLLIFTGDAGATAESLLALPVLLTELAYSRKFEHEADEYSYQYLAENQINPQHFANIMIRLEQHYHCSTDEEGNNSTEQKECLKETMHEPVDKDTAEKIGGYLSTHPTNQERLERFTQGH